MSEERPELAQKQIGYCQRFMRVATAVIMGSFVLIIGLTTASTGEFVQITAKILYYVIVVSAALSIAVWLSRTRLEKRMRAPAWL